MKTKIILSFIILIILFFFLPIYPQPMELSIWGNENGQSFSTITTDWEFVSMIEFFDEYEYLLPYKITITIVNIILLLLYPAIIIAIFSKILSTKKPKILL